MVPVFPPSPFRASAGQAQALFELQRANRAVFELVLHSENWHKLPVPQHGATRVSIVIPTLGSPWLRRCLFSLRQNISSAISHEIVVVANGPSAAHLASAVTLFSPPVRLLTSVANLGFGGG